MDTQTLPELLPSVATISPDLAPETIVELLDASARTGICTAKITITPDLAKLLLRRNSHNRGLRDRAVADYARDARANAWALNGEAIKIAVDGTILDGQHRLQACTLADTPFDTLIVVGLLAEAQETMDSGRRRTAADVMQLRGETHASIIASVTRRAWAWARGDRRFAANYFATRAEMSRFLAEHPELRRSAEVAARVRKEFPHIPPSILGVAHFLFNAIDQGDCAAFFDRLADGADLPAGHPVLALRNRVTSERAEAGRLSEARHLTYLVRAWNAVRDGRTLGRLTHNATHAIPEPK